jgi:hypothetical protein
MKFQTVNWILASSTSFVVLVNGSPSNLFYTTRDLRQGFPMYYFLLLLVEKELSGLITPSEEEGAIRGNEVGGSSFLSIFYL